ncbi:MAG TPA: TolC family protein [Gemmatimonadales bacterium]|nr:TolC family protein [Gemmatimonadales bacterium]
MHRALAAALAAAGTLAGVGTVAPPPLRAQAAAASPPPLTRALTLTRAEAIDSALARNPALAAAREQIVQARARGTQATALPDVDVTWGFSDEPRLFGLGGAGSHDLDVGWTLPFPDKIRLRGRVAGGDVAAARFTYLQLRQAIAAATAQTYDSLLVAEQHRRDLAETVGVADTFLLRTQARFDAGAVPKLDVIRARVDVAQARNDLLAAERDVGTARAGLNRLLGRVLGAPLQAADTLAVPDTLPPLDLLERQALARRPELRSLAAQRRGARAATALAQEYWLPDVGIGVGRTTGGGAPATYSTSVGISVPLFFWQHQRGEVRESRHRERELAASEQDLALQVAQEVRVAYATAATALRQAVYLRDELLPEAREAQRIATVSYQLGRSSILDVLDARRTLVAAQSQYADALGAANDAVAQLQLAVGAAVGKGASDEQQ